MERTLIDPSKTYVQGCHPDGWSTSFSQTSSHGRDYANAELSVYRFHRDEPNRWGGIGVSESHPEWDGLLFATVAECRQFQLDHNLIREFNA